MDALLAGDLMKIDFTKFDNPADAIDFAVWRRVREVDLTQEEIEDFASIGCDPASLGFQYELPACDVDFVFAPEYRISRFVQLVVARFRRNRSLQALSLNSGPLGRDAIYEAVSELVRDWKLQSVDVTSELEPENRWEAVSSLVDGIAQLRSWRENPPDCFPSFIAQTDPNPFPGIWFMRAIINPSLDQADFFQLSIQAFWRDREFDDENADRRFWTRADAVIELANTQANRDRIERVANSLVYAAARYCSFDYWRSFRSREAYEKSMRIAIENYVGRFRTMLLENIDSYSTEFESVGDTPD